MAKRCAPAISPTSLAAVSGPQPGSATSSRREAADEVGDLGFERLDRLGEFAQAAQLVARDPDAHRLLSARETPADPGAPLDREQRAAGQLELGPEIVQIPLQRAVERHARANQPLAVIDQQPQIELGPGQRGGRQRLDAGGQRGPGDRDRVDAIGLAALAA